MRCGGDVEMIPDDEAALARLDVLGSFRACNGPVVIIGVASFVSFLGAELIGGGWSIATVSLRGGLLITR